MKRGGAFTVGAIGAVGSMAVLALRDAGYPPIEMTDGVTELISKYPAGPDLNSYLTAGQIIATNGVRVDSLDWVFGLWPPGLPILHALVMRVGLGDSLVLAESVLLSLLVGTLLAVLWSSSSWRIPLRILFVACVPFAMFIGIGVDRYRLLLSDVWAVAFASIAIGLIWRRTPVTAILGGLSLAAAAYFRASYALATYAVAVVALLFAFWLLFRFMRGLGHRASITIGMGQVTTIIFGFTAVAALLPWHAFLHLENDQTRWSNADAVTWSYVWMTDEFTREAGGAWVSDLGGNWACDLDASTCKTVTAEELTKEFPFGTDPRTVATWRDTALATAANQPFKFVQNRAAFTLNGIAIGNTGTFSVTPDSTGVLRILFAFAIITCWLVVITKSCMKRIPAALISVVIVVVVAATIVFQHIEARYVWAPLVLASASLAVASPRSLAARVYSGSSSDEGLPEESNSIG